MKKILLVIFLFLQVKLICGQQYVWTQKANYGSGAIYDAFSFTVDSIAYVGTGVEVGPIFHTDFWKYNPQSNIWTQEANFPGAARYGSRTFTINYFGYVVTGYAGTAGYLNDLWEYDVALNIWNQNANFPGTARYNVTAFSINNFGYVGLGSVAGNTFFNDFWKYDPLLDAWTQITNFPGASRGAASDFVINGFAYVGAGSNAILGLNFSDFYKFDPAANSWAMLSNFPGQARNAAFAFTINNKGYLTQGYDFASGTQQTLYNDFWEYNPIGDLWTQLPDFPDKKRYEGIYFSIGNKGYIGLGCDTVPWNIHFMNDLWEYAPSTNGINNLQLSGNDIKVYITKNNILKIDFLKIADKNFVIKIFDLNGKIIYTSILNFEINLNKQSKGIYLYEINFKNKILKTGKFNLY
ncbi:MAG: kelch repeat-containing protein [Bacteroidia bacterium]